MHFSFTFLKQLWLKLPLVGLLNTFSHIGAENKNQSKLMEIFQIFRRDFKNIYVVICFFALKKSKLFTYEQPKTISNKVF